MDLGELGLMRKGFRVDATGRIIHGDCRAVNLFFGPIIFGPIISATKAARAVFAL